MLIAIIEKEIREILGSVKFGITFSACAVLILLSFYVGAANYNANVQQYNAAKAENLRSMEGLTSWLNLEQHRIFLSKSHISKRIWNGWGLPLGR